MDLRLTFIDCDLLETWLFLNCYRIKNIIEQKEKKALGQVMALKKTYIGLV